MLLWGEAVFTVNKLSSVRQAADLLMSLQCKEHYLDVLENWTAQLLGLGSITPDHSLPRNSPKQTSSLIPLPADSEGKARMHLVESGSSGTLTQREKIRNGESRE